MRVFRRIVTSVTFVATSAILLRTFLNEGIKKMSGVRRSDAFHDGKRNRTIRPRREETLPQTGQREARSAKVWLPVTTHLEGHPTVRTPGVEMPVFSRHRNSTPVLVRRPTNTFRINPATVFDVRSTQHEMGIDGGIPGSYGHGNRVPRQPEGTTTSNLNEFHNAYNYPIGNSTIRDKVSIHDAIMPTPEDDISLQNKSRKREMNNTTTVSKTVETTERNRSTMNEETKPEKENGVEVTKESRENVGAVKTPEYDIPQEREDELDVEPERERKLRGPMVHILNAENHFWTMLADDIRKDKEKEKKRKEKKKKRNTNKQETVAIVETHRHQSSVMNVGTLRRARIFLRKKCAQFSRFVRSNIACCYTNADD